MATEVFIPGLEKWTKPNVRLVFLPDPGYVIFDADLKQADAQIVAWEAQDRPLMDFFIAAKSDPDLPGLHDVNSRDIYAIPEGRPIPRNQRQMAKHGVHALNFGAQPATLTKKLDMTRHQADQFFKRWFTLHPAIKKWHYQVEETLMRTRTVTNKFGYRRIFFGRLDGLLPEALAWVPQSTTVNIIDKGMLNLDQYLPEAQLLLQVHDSVVGQFKIEHWSWIKPKIREAMLIEVPYDEPLTIPVDFSASLSSWGRCKQISWRDNAIPD